MTKYIGIIKKSYQKIHEILNHSFFINFFNKKIATMNIKN